MIIRSAMGRKSTYGLVNKLKKMAIESQLIPQLAIIIDVYYTSITSTVFCHK